MLNRKVKKSGAQHRALLEPLAASLGLDYNVESLAPGNSPSQLAYAFAECGGLLLLLRLRRWVPVRGPQDDQTGVKAMEKSLGGAGAQQAAVMLAHALAAGLEVLRLEGKDQDADYHVRFRALLQEHLPLPQRPLDIVDGARVEYRTFETGDVRDPIRLGYEGGTGYHRALQDPSFNEGQHPDTNENLVDAQRRYAGTFLRRTAAQWDPRGAEPGAWLLRGLIECGHCGVGASCHKIRGRNGAFHRYYNCRNHDILRAGGQEQRCPERNIRANELDDYVFQQVRQALLDPRQLIAGERAVIASIPPDENELIASQLTRLTSALHGTERERMRLLDAYQAELLALDELTRRTTKLTARRHQLAREKDVLTERSAELASENRLRRGLAHFAERVVASLDELDFDARQHLLRLIVEKVRVTGWHVEIHLKIPLADDGPGDDRAPRTPNPNDPPSSDMGLRSLGGAQRQELPAARTRRRELRQTAPAGPTNRTLMTDGARSRRLTPARVPIYWLTIRFPTVA